MLQSQECMALTPYTQPSPTPTSAPRKSWVLRFTQTERSTTRRRTCPTSRSTISSGSANSGSASRSSPTPSPLAGRGRSWCTEGFPCSKSSTKAWSPKPARQWPNSPESTKCSRRTRSRTATSSPLTWSTSTRGTSWSTTTTWWASGPHGQSGRPESIARCRSCW